MAAKQLALVIDTKRCVDCHTCAVACKGENNLPDTNWWNRVLTVGGETMDSPSGEFPYLQLQYVTLSCQHCANPACTKVCPTGATHKRPEDGVVMQDYDKCVGCRMCMAACPYTGVRLFNWEEPKYQVDFAIGGEGVPAHQKHTVEKCVLCAHRLADGLEPACVEVCPARARHFGDINDPTSEVSQLLRQRTNFTLLPEKETRPSVHFLS